MENIKVGTIIKKLRQDKGMTQKNLADKLNISDKAVSKWERGLGCPDISLIPDICDLLGVDAQSLILGEVSSNEFVGGNMKNSKYFICPSCNNITLCTGNAEISCCGKKLVESKAEKATEKLNVDIIENEWFIHSDHPMTKDHYISFVAFATGDKVLIYKQYPEWNLQLRIPKKGHGMLIWYCTNHGLFYQLL